MAKVATPKKKSSNKAILIVVALVVLIAGGIFYYLNMNGKSILPVNNPVTSIKDALMHSVSMECEYKDAEGRSTKAYIKNGAIRTDVVDPTNTNASGSFILKDKKMYTWHDKEGYVMTIPDVTPSEGETSDTATNESENIMKDLEEYKDNCKTSIVSDSLFNPPADVKFQDMSKMMESGLPSSGDNADVQKMMEQYKNNAGSQETPTDDSGNSDY